MIDETRLRADLIRLLTATENNIRRRCDEDPAVNRPLEERYDSARRAGRTGMTFSAWREGEITQAGVAWLLACVFIRFLEDNDLLAEVYLSGPGDRVRAAQDRRTHWYRSNPTGNDREYLLGIFTELEGLPGLKGLLDRAHNPLWSLGPDGDGAKAIWDFFQSADPDTQVLRHDFTDSVKSTRFLGDLYQNISASARKQYALLQTPGFIVDFILDRTLEPALKEFPLDGFRLIDPACGSGHFLLAAFERLFRLWANRDGDVVAIVQKTLDCVYGVDLNPYAAAIARFRLLIGSILASGIAKLNCAPDWEIHVSAGDSLLFGPNKMVPSMVCLPTEDPEQLRVILQAQGYNAVVGNPPYINVHDPELRKLYRGFYKSCSGKYQVSVPFTELFFDLAERGGQIGMIASNAFMKRSFGRKLIKSYLPKWDLTHVVDTSGVYLPGHGTPTTILLASNRTPVAATIRVVRGIAGETSAPDDPAQAPVWTEICREVDNPGFLGRYVSVADAPREVFHHHPWSIGGGGAAELKERLDDASSLSVLDAVEDIGVAGMSNADDVIVADQFSFNRRGVNRSVVRPMLLGEDVRDWQASSVSAALFPYGSEIMPLEPTSGFYKWMWPCKTVLGNRATFSQGTYFSEGRPWWGWHQVSLSRYLKPLSITFSDVATHNHFVLDRGGRVFNRHAPLIKLRSTDEQEAVSLLGALNSSSACFWLRQVCFPKGGDQVGSQGARTRHVLWDVYCELDVSKVSQLPLPARRPTDLAVAIQAACDERSALLPAALIAHCIPTSAALDSARSRAHELLLRTIALQEELDWHVYHLYGLIDESLTLPIDQVPPVQLGERVFEIRMARNIQSGELVTEWFTRHSSTPRTEIPDHWPEPYRALVQRRLDVIINDRDIALIEQPEYKRRWNLTPWEELEQEALRNWLLDRLEDARYWPTSPPALTSVARLADTVRGDSEFLQVAELYRSRPDFDVADLVQELVARESVPFLPLLRYKESGLRKRVDWERTWELQRREDAGDKIEIPMPPKYERTDFLADYWRLRGKLDVPKERWISYPYLERDADKSPVIAWAGYDHGQQALALASYGYEMRSNEGWTADRLIPILGGLQQLQPWLDQWHNEIDPNTQQRLNESIRTFVESEMAQLGITAEKIHEWRPPTRVRTSKPRKAAPRRTPASEAPTSTE